MSRVSPSGPVLRLWPRLASSLWLFSDSDRAGSRREGCWKRKRRIRNARADSELEKQEARGSGAAGVQAERETRLRAVSMSQMDRGSTAVSAAPVSVSNPVVGTPSRPQATRESSTSGVTPRPRPACWPWGAGIRLRVPGGCGGASVLGVCAVSRRPRTQCPSILEKARGADVEPTPPARTATVTRSSPAPRAGPKPHSGLRAGTASTRPKTPTAARTPVPSPSRTGVPSG